ncbi:NAD(P)-dependent oxidoreductase [Nitrospirillum iridis]|uniref:Phosphoglycerate dehydrogenase-like enzyme n=1 Tax=Nitrospirillum iridis TaxID=765888 RepID=A0A7X0B6F1_9PROT|nr:NAD(P)-dependent oxidoreductase [Nitrospirillum iridis]MBB6255321.1 phosphoglycerate dehydrogenase-like enzyme [Nitrospirillum iridis]
MTLTIATTFEPGLVERLRAHPAKPEVWTFPAGHPPWEVPPFADALFTYARDFVGYPAEKPAGWPFALRWIQVATAGVDAFPGWLFAGPPVTCGRHIASENIAEFVLALLLQDEKGLDRIRITSRAAWRQPPIGTLEGKTVGLLGVGAIGQAVARRLAGFGVRLIGLRRQSPASSDGLVEWQPSLEALMRQSDHLIVALPLTPLTRNIINRHSLAWAKPGLHLVNVSRGGLVDQDDLLSALDAGVVRAASLDVTVPEPLPDGHPFYTHPAVRLTPHLSWYSTDYEDRIWAKVSDNLQRFLEGRDLLDVVSPDRGY